MLKDLNINMEKHFMLRLFYKITRRPNSKNVYLVYLGGKLMNLKILMRYTNSQFSHYKKKLIDAGKRSCRRSVPIARKEVNLIKFDV